MKLKLILVLCLIYFYINYCSSATTTRLTTTTTKKKLEKCFQSFTGIYSGKQYNVSTRVPCSTSCLFYKETANNADVESGSLCDDEPCNGGLFIVQNNYSVRYDCCDSDLCNVPAYTQLRLNYQCEFNTRVTSRKRLTFPVFKQALTNVRQCYYCDQCASPKSARIVNCADRNSSITSFTCQFAYVDNGRSSYWNADCYNMNDNFFLSYEKKSTKVAGCQSNLCNSPANMLKILNATLCSDGFYA